jgi:hypothetical protein
MLPIEAYGLLCGKPWIYSIGCILYSNKLALVLGIGQKG